MLQEAFVHKKSLPVSREEYVQVTALHVELSQIGVTFQFSWLFRNNSLHGIVEQLMMNG